MPWKDAIVEEVRKSRDAYAKRFNYDLDAIYRDLQKERCSGRVVVPCPEKKTAMTGSDAAQSREPS